MTISINAEKVFDTIQYPFLMKTSKPTKDRKEITQLDKGHLCKVYTIFIPLYTGNTHSFLRINHTTNQTQIKQIPNS